MRRSGWLRSTRFSASSTRRRRMLLPERFWSKVEKTPTCWLWHGATLRDGYGQIKWDSKIVRAHRLAYASVHGWPSLDLDHLCRVRYCGNPDHLEEVGTR